MGCERPHRARVDRFLPRFVATLSCVAPIGVAFACLSLLHPAATFLKLALGLATLVVSGLILTRRSGTRAFLGSIAAFAIFAGGLVSFYQANLGDPRRPFYRAYASIQAGMTEGEVDKLFRDQCGPRLPEKRGGSNRVSYVLDPTDGCFDAEIVRVHLDAGRVVTAEYLPD